jgi:hypothetical protein
LEEIPNSLLKKLVPISRDKTVVGFSIQKRCQDQKSPEDRGLDKIEKALPAF